MPKGRDLALRFMRGVSWKVEKSVEDYARAVSFSSTYRRRREVTTSRSREQECGHDRGRERGPERVPEWDRRER